MFDYDERQRLFGVSRQLGRKIIKLARGKKSFGSFFLEDYSKEIMTYLPCYQQSIGGVPMDEENELFWEHHVSGELDKIKNYDFAIIFKHEIGQTNDFLIKEAKEYGKNKYYIVIQSQEENDVGKMMFSFVSEFMKDNPYLPLHHRCEDANPVVFDK